MSHPFFDHPILNSPYDYPRRHWELDESGQPTQQVIERRRRAEFITPIPKPKKRRASAKQDEMVFEEGKGLSSKEQQYDPTSIIKQLHDDLDDAVFDAYGWADRSAADSRPRAYSKEQRFMDDK